ncbi:hypothetical protein M7I_1032 [Glarea lozoyensis 74030]|uniref:C6 transcription factor n=1 Tax=Glarea lozoyensis (strain ATCC 74030 / MF5533) TaxID=1104152 RepID=H0EEZ5_GLAL7|nr:hypothetical protein M7I_1032 [Glarea lozoyensis 74030]
MYKLCQAFCTMRLSESRRWQYDQSWSVSTTYAFRYHSWRATKSWTDGLQTASALLSKIDETNCEAIWIFSNFPLFWTLATAHQTDDFLLIGNSIGASWLDLVRGASAILSQTHEQLHAGSLGPTFRLGAIRADLREQAAYDFPPDQDPTQDLRSQMAYSKLPPESYDLCMKAIEELRKSFALFYNNANRTSNDFGDIFIWLFRVNNGYLDLIRDHCQEAIAIFAYFCVMLKALDHKWWIQGAAVHLLKQIWDALDEDHRFTYYFDDTSSYVSSRARDLKLNIKYVSDKMQTLNHIS